MDLTRRKFIKGVVSTTALGSLPDPLFSLTLTGRIREEDAPLKYYFVPTSAVPESCRVYHSPGAAPVGRDIFPRALDGLRIIRPFDLLDITLRWQSVNFIEKSHTISGHKMVDRFVERLKDSKLIVQFPPQHVVEQTVNDLEDITRPMHARRNGPSRLVFDLSPHPQPSEFGPTDKLPIPYTLESVLNWYNYYLLVVPLALPETTPFDQWPRNTVVGKKGSLLRPPCEDETSIEFPWGLYLSPDAKERWLTPSPKAKGTTEWELWRTQLAPRRENSKQKNTKTHGESPEVVSPKLRAVWWNPEGPAGNVAPPVELPTPDDRKSLVFQTTTVGDASVTTPPKAIDAPHFMLSSRGAYSDISVAWEYDELNCYHLPDKINGWVQHTTWGRDQHVIVSHPGYGMPFCHPVSLQEVHERLVRPARLADDKRFVAALVKRWYCVIETATLNYATSETARSEVAQLQRGFCFQSVTISPRKTPPLIGPPNDDTTIPFKMVLEATGEVFKFKITATCIGENGRGKTLEFYLPLYWIPKDTAENNGAATRSAYTAQGFTSFRRSDLGGQKMVFVGPPPTRPSEQSRDLSLEVNSLRFSVNQFTSTSRPTNWRLAVYPSLDSANIRLDHLAAFGLSDAASAVGDLSYHPQYLSDGLSNPQLQGGSNPAVIDNGNELYAKIDNANVTSFDSNNSGGMVAPNLVVKSMSRRFGPYTASPPPPSHLHGLAGPGLDAATSHFNASDYFGDAATLLGAVGLSDIVDDVKDAFEQIDRVPKYISETLHQVDDKLHEIQECVRTVRTSVEKLQQKGRQYTGGITSRINEIIYIESNRLMERMRRIVAQEIAALDALKSDIIAEIQNVAGITQADKDAVEQLAEDLRMLATSLPIDPADYEDLLENRVAAAFSDTVQQSKVLSQLRSYLAGKADAIQQLKQQANNFETLWIGTLDTVQTDLTAALIEASNASLNPDAATAIAKTICQDGAVFNAIRSSWKTNPSLPAVDDLADRITSRLHDLVDANLEPALSNKLQGLKSKWNGKVAAQSRSFVQLQLHVMDVAQRLNLQWTDIQRKAWSDLQKELDPRTLLTGGQANSEVGLQQLVKRTSDVLAGLRNFPWSLFTPLTDTLKKLEDSLEGPEKFLSEGLQTLRQVGDLIADLRSSFTIRSQQALGIRSTSGVPDAIEARLQAVKSQLKKSIRSEDIPPKNFLTDRLNTYHASLTQAVASLLALGADASKIQALQGDIDAFFLSLQQANNDLNLGIADWTKFIDDIIDLVFDQIDQALLRAEEMAQELLTELANDMASVLGLVGGFFDSLPKELALDFSWNPPLKAGDVFEPSLQGQAADFQIQARIRKSLLPQEITQRPSIRVSGSLTNFRLHLLPQPKIIIIGFSSVTFESVDGGTPKVSVNVASVDFDEALKYLADLAKQMNPDNGFFIQLVSGGIQAGFRYTVPAITTGAFNLVGLSFAVAVELRFNGDPLNLVLSVSERSRPFMLSSGVYGGAGFFSLTATPKGVSKIEASIEFGADTALTIGVATGRGMVNAGVYFSTSQESASLFGFVHACGILNVLNLITVVEDFYLGLGYERHGNLTYAVGEVVVTVEIDFFMFSISVSLHYRKEIEGSNHSQSQQGASSADLGIQNMSIPLNQSRRHSLPTSSESSSNFRDARGFQSVQETVMDFEEVANKWPEYRRAFLAVPH